MDPNAHLEIVAQHVADLHRQAAKQRLLRELRASRKPTVHRRRIWKRLPLRRPRPAAMARMPAGPVVARGGKTAARRAG